MMRALQIAIMIGVVLSAGATIAQRPAPPKTVIGQADFRDRCGGCHLERGFGTRVLGRRTEGDKALLERRDDLTADYVRIVVRRGIGSMPMIRKEELSDAQLGQIAAYLGKGK